MRKDNPGLEIGQRHETLGLESRPTFESLCRESRLRDLVREKLRAHASKQSGSSTRIVRALLLLSAPSLDAGEITDMGSINQRAVLDHRRSCVNELYRETPAAEVIVID